MPHDKKINPRELEDYLTALARCSKVPTDNDSTLRELLRSHSEARFRIVGGSRCSVCNAHVRHVIPVVSEQAGGVVRRFDCLCTRCLEGEKAKSICMFLEVCERQIAVRLQKDQSSDETKLAALVAKAGKLR